MLFLIEGQKTAQGIQFLDNHPICRKHILPLKLRDALVKPAFFIHRHNYGKVVFQAGKIILLAVARGNMHQAASFFFRDIIRQDYFSYHTVF